MPRSPCAHLLPRSVLLAFCSARLAESASAFRTAAARKDIRVAGKNNTVALLLRGESFRTGGWQSRQTGGVEGIERQTKATQSQIRFLVAPFAQKGFDVDVFSATYSSDELPRLIDMWGGQLTNHVEIDRSVLDSQATSVWSVADEAIKYSKIHNKAYRWVIVIRHDMEFKQNAADLIINALPDDKFLFPFQMTSSKRNQFGVKQPLYRVPDTMQVMDGRFLSVFKREIEDGWPAEDTMVKRLRDAIGADKLGFLMEWYADSNPEAAINPLYKFSGRHEGPQAPQTLLKFETSPRS